MKKAPATRNRPSRPTHDLKRMLFTRFMLVVAVFILWIGGISVRLVHLQVNQHTYLLARAQGQRLNIKKTRHLRGTIYDRNGSVLAMSVPVKTLFADPTEIDDTQRAGREIAKAVGLSSQKLTLELENAKNSGRRYFPIAKKVDDDNVRRINRALFDPDVKKSDDPKYEGVYWADDQRRSYPYRSLAAQTIGFSNADEEGMAGVEQSRNNLLEGEIIKKIQERDRLGRVYDEKVIEREPPQDIVLTIDKSIQIIAEEALAQGVANANARAGMAVVLDPGTGEILALANAPTFDPEKLGSAIPDTSNHLIQSVYSPGSVFKLVTYSAALEKRLIKPTDMIDAGDGTIEVAGHKFTDSHHIGRVSYAQALAHSSNVCAIKTGLRVGKPDFYAMVQRMGFGTKTGVELPAETAGIVRNPDKWNGDSLASMSIGYEIGVTPLQIAAAFATIANDGIRSQPHIIREIRDSEGNTISITEPNQSQVVSAETARDLGVMLRQVVLSGTGRRAQLDGYSSAGKTGTAWKFDPKTKRVERSKYMSTFVGFAPVNDPRFVIAVVMDEPKAGARDGGTVSAPVFRDIAQQLLVAMNVPRDLERSSQNTVADDIPEVTGGDKIELKGPPDESEKKVAGTAETKPKNLITAPEKKGGEKPVSEKDKISNKTPKTIRQTPAIWKTKPKT
jgi:cell division protein FtsI (penicillin-binding protein 3)